MTEWLASAIRMRPEESENVLVEEECRREHV